MNKNTPYHRLPGPENLKLRTLYRALYNHHKDASCPMCDSYPQYGTTIIRGDILEHIGDIAKSTAGDDDMRKLVDVGLITLEEVSPRQYRITFDIARESEITA